jgi:hypothetical protein
LADDDKVVHPFLFGSLLPENVTVVIFGDSSPGVDMLGLGSGTLQARSCKGGVRVISYIVNSEADDSDVISSAVASDFSLGIQQVSSCQRAGIDCASALLRAASALSLADGPCSLSCRDFLAEVSEQLRDLAAAAALPAPKIMIRSHPLESTAGEVRWPIAAAPKNKATIAAMTCTSPLSKAPSVCPSTTASTRSLTPPEVDRQRRSKGGTGDHRARRVQSAGVNPRRRAMPTDLSGLTKVLTGGAVGGGGVNTNASSLRRSQHGNHDVPADPPSL